MSRYYDEATGKRSDECLRVMGRCYVGVEGIALTPQLIRDRSFVSFELARLERERDAALRTVAGLERMLKTQRLLMKWRPRCTCTNCTARGYNDNWTINHGDDWQTFPTLASAVAAWVAANPEEK